MKKSAVLATIVLSLNALTFNQAMSNERYVEGKMDAETKSRFNTSAGTVDVEAKAELKTIVEQAYAGLMPSPEEFTLAISKLSPEQRLDIIRNFEAKVDAQYAKVKNQRDSMSGEVSLYTLNGYFAITSTVISVLSGIYTFERAYDLSKYQHGRKEVPFYKTVSRAPYAKFFWGSLALTLGSHAIDDILEEKVTFEQDRLNDLEDEYNRAKKLLEIAKSSIKIQIKLKQSIAVECNGAQECLD